ncbi:MAG: insulinase family protein [Verrucomicrobia bacterium]|nr:insulinase family protein [Verrucomicrobiota bacterium]
MDRPAPAIAARSCKRAFACAWALWLFVASAFAAAAAEVWPSAESDLPPVPGLRQGTLPNGLRYLILPNAEPRDRISLRLLVAVGSVHEADDERGLAHFVEHMAFRGTRSHPAGSLTAALQRLGLGLGPDSAAFTYYDHTIYHLELPDTKEATLREGLHVFREYADEVTFVAPLIERESGVILSEKATRDTPGARNAEANTAFLFSGSRQVRRPIIGTRASVLALKRDQFVAFYDAWYRPERMAVIAVGNLEPEAVARLIMEEFSSLTARGEPRPDPADLIPDRADPPSVDIFADPGLLGVGLAFEHPVPRPRAPDTHARRVRQLHEGLAFAMFHQRLQRISHEPNATFVAPYAQLNPLLPGWQIAAIGVSGKIDGWQIVAGEIEREHRRALLHGFTPSELTEARAYFATSYEQAARNAPTWPSGWLAGRLADSLLQGFVLVPPEAQQRDLAADLATASLEDCTRAFREVWTSAAPHVFVSANPSFKITRQQIADALNVSRQQPTPPREELAPPVFAYTDFGPTGSLVRDEVVADLDVRLTQFANGVRANFKATTFDADTVEVRIRVGEGKLGLPAKQPGLDTFADTVFTAGGLGRHTMQEIARLVAGRSLTYGFQVGTDASLLTARCARRDLLFCLQLLAAHLTDAAYRPEILREAGARFGSLYSSLIASPGGPIMVQAPRVMFRGDPRFGPPMGQELSARTLAELSAWLEPQLKHGAIELSVVGDITWDETREALSRTFGALPARRPRADTRSAASQGFARPQSGPQVYGIDAKLGRAAIACYWPAPDLKDAHEERRCRLLSQVLSDRLRIRLREELGTAYSPAAAFLITPGFAKLNYFTLYAEVEPRRTQQALQIIQREATALAASGPEADEFVRAHQPYLHQMSGDRRTNAYWGATVLLDAQLSPARLPAARDRTDDIAAITQADLARLAKRYLAPKNAFTFLTVPAVSGPARPPP